MIEIGKKYRLVDGMMSHLNGHIVTVQKFEYKTYGLNFYEVTVDDMDDMKLVTSEKKLEEAELKTQEKSQDEEWSKLTEEEKKNVREVYKNHPDWTDVINALVDKFGRHNLYSKVNDWKETFELIQNRFDYVFNIKDTDFYRGLNILMEYKDKKVFDKIIATYKIIEILEYGYDGVISDKEWKSYKDTTDTYYSIVCRDNGTILIELVDSEEQPVNRNLLTFRSLLDAERFMKSTENFELVRQYYML